MAKKLEAVNKYRTKVKLRSTIGMKDIVNYISSRTGLNKGELQMALSELSETVQFYCKQGQGVKLEGLGTYLPKITREGKFSISYRLSMDIKNSLNTPGSFTGDLINRSNIGKSTEELCAFWDEENPENKVSDL